MAAKMILKFREAVIGEYPLEGKEVTIGRKPGNTIQIDNLAVSGRHARVVRVGSKLVLEDLNSTNGTYVNGERITKHVLRHGDRITVGKHTLIFVEEQQAAQAAPEPEEESDLEKTVVLTPQRAQAAGIKPRPTSGGTRVKLPLGEVRIISGPLAGRTIELSASLTTIGKDDHCRIRVKGLMVGKQAAAITRRPNGYFIAYVEGFTKPKVNGDTVEDEPRLLNDGDIIEIGDTKMQFFLNKQA